MGIGELPEQRGTVAVAVWQSVSSIRWSIWLSLNLLSVCVSVCGIVCQIFNQSMVRSCTIRCWCMVRGVWYTTIVVDNYRGGELYALLSSLVSLSALTKSHVSTLRSLTLRRCSPHAGSHDVRSAAAGWFARVDGCAGSSSPLDSSIHERRWCHSCSFASSSSC